MYLIYFVLIPIVCGVVSYAVGRRALRVFVTVVEITLFAFFCYVFATIVQNGNIAETLGSDNPVLGISLIANSYNMALVGLSVVLFFASFVYTMHEDFFDNKFVMLFLILQGLLCGVFLTDDLFNIFVLLEVATVVVSILIMYKRDMRSVYDGMVYLLSQIVCMLFYLFGIGYLYKIFGVLSISEISKMMGNADPESLVAPFAFIMTAICLKSAFFPLFSWLPRAHATPSAPSAVSAILSGLYVKNGIYLFFVFINLFSSIDYGLFFTLLGALTAIIGFILAFSQTDIKLLLAFSTISQIGLVSLGISAQNEISMYGALYHIISHALFKSLLFLSAGIIIKHYKTRNIDEIRGVMKTMPLTGVATVLAILGISGAPFFNASVSKYFMQYGAKGDLIEILIMIVNFGTILSFVKYSHVLWGRGITIKKQSKHKETVLLLLGTLCLAGGVFGTRIVNLLFDTTLYIDARLYAEKSLIYFVMVIGAFLVYKFFLSKNNLLHKLRKLSFNFQQIVMAILIFYIVLTFSI